MIKKTFCLFMLFLCLSTSAFAMTFTQMSKQVYLAINESANATAPNGEKLVLVNEGNCLKMMSADRNYEYLSFINSDGGSSGIDFSIRDVYTQNPNMHLWEIIASRGAHAKNCGYWLVGQNGNQYVTYISIDSLSNMGYTPQEWHRISTSVNNGQYIIKSTHEYLPPGALYGYQMQSALDLSIRADWDSRAQWFALMPD